MALEGNVKDFGLSEIFQLIAIQKKSGLLSVSGDQNMAIFFRDGAIISTRDRRSIAHDPLKDYLLKYGYINRREMNNLQRIQLETKLDLTDILISENYYTPEELSAIFTEQIQESIQEVLSWPKSYYTFIGDNNVLQGVTSFAAIKVEGVLMESMRRIDEFPELQRIFPSEKMLLRRLDGSEEIRTELDRCEAAVYELLEYEQSLGELIAHARMARFCTYEACKNLLEKGLLEIRSEPASLEESVQEMVIEEYTQRCRRFVPAVAAIIILLGSFAIGEYAIPFLFPPDWNSRSRGEVKIVTNTDGQSLAGSIDELAQRHVEALLREGLEEYFAVKGSYPITLDVLVVRRFIPETVVAKAQQNNLRYRLEQNGASYSLERG
jgi:hypothetical protein